MFVLVCGCPRSGTTELAGLLNKHSEIYLGCERYLYLYYKTNEHVTPAYFAPERFCNLQPGDTFWDSLDEMPGWDKNGVGQPGRTKIGKTRVYGDKAPDIVFHLQNVLPAFLPDCQILICVRDLLSVARSWQARAQNKEDHRWSRDHGFEYGMRQWAGAMVVLLDYQARGLPVLDVYTPKLYRVRPLELDRIFNVLGLKIDESTQSALANAIDWRLDNMDARPERAKMPSPEERALILGDAHIETTVSKLRAARYRIPLDTLFWIGFEAEFDAKSSS